MLPSYTVIVPNYNHAHYLPECLEGVLGQTVRPDEIIVVDDCSTDNSREVIERYASEHPSIRVIYQEQNRCGLWINEVVREVKTDYFIVRAADDKDLPTFAEKSLTLLEAHPNAAYCTSYFSQFDDQTEGYRAVPLGWSREPRYFSPEEFAAVTPCGCIPGHASLMKTEYLLRAGAFLPELRWHADWFILQILAARHGICFVPEPLALLRVGTASFSSAGTRNWEDQRRVVESVVSLLYSETYSDCLWFFKKSLALSSLAPDIVRYVDENGAKLGMPRLCEIASMMAPESVQALAPVLQESLRLGRYLKEDELPLIERVLKWRADDGPAHKILGLRLFAIGNREVAAQHLAAALAVLPGDEEIAWQLFHYCLERDEIELALAYTELLLQLRPDHVGANVWHAKLRERLMPD